MELSLSAQAAYFLRSLALGLVLGAAYDLLRALRMLLRMRRFAVNVSDVLFFTLCGVATSLFALPFNKGEVRVFVIVGEAAALLTYRLTVGSIMGKFYGWLAVILRKIIQKVHKIIEKTFHLLLKLTGGLVYNINVLIDGLRKCASGQIQKHRKGKKHPRLTKG